MWDSPTFFCCLLGREDDPALDALRRLFVDWDGWPSSGGVEVGIMESVILDCFLLVAACFPFLGAMAAGPALELQA